MHRIAWHLAVIGGVTLLGRGLRLWATSPRLMLLGDFNIAPEDRDVHDERGLGPAQDRVQRGAV